MNYTICNIIIQFANGILICRRVFLWLDEGMILISVFLSYVTVIKSL